MRAPKGGTGVSPLGQHHFCAHSLSNPAKLQLPIREEGPPSGGIVLDSPPHTQRNCSKKKKEMKR